MTLVRRQQLKDEYVAGLNNHKCHRPSDPACRRAHVRGMTDARIAQKKLEESYDAAIDEKPNAKRDYGGPGLSGA